MELKTARLTLLIDPAKKAAFERLCARQDQTPSQVVRQTDPRLPDAARRSLRPERSGSAARTAAAVAAIGGRSARRRRCDEDTLARLISVA